MNTLSPLPRSLGAKVHRRAREVSRLLHGACLAGVLSASEIPTDYANRMSDAIYIAEGGEKTRYPYGVKMWSGTKALKLSKEAARRITIKTIQNTWQRWEKAGRPGDFIGYLGDRYCPPSVDRVGNRNWKRNVRRLIR